MNGKFMILVGFAGVLIGISYYNALSYFIIVASLMLILTEIFFVKGYRNKTYYLTLFILVALLGMSSVYNLLVIPQITAINYINIVLFLAILIKVIMAYKGRFENHKIPWKDEWYTSTNQESNSNNIGFVDEPTPIPKTKAENGYLVCNKCEGYYELQPGESPDDFSDECECGGKLEYRDSLQI
jgi:hypothetical protein